MDIAGIISILKIVADNLPGAISTAEQLVDLGTKLYNSLNNGTDPTPEEIAALRAAIDADVMTALEPLPPPEPGDPDYVNPDDPKQA